MAVLGGGFVGVSVGAEAEFELLVVILVADFIVLLVLGEGEVCRFAGKVAVLGEGFGRVCL